MCCGLLLLLELFTPQPVHFALLLPNGLLLPHCEGWAATAQLNPFLNPEWWNSRNPSMYPSQTENSPVQAAPHSLNFF